MGASTGTVNLTGGPIVYNIGPGVPPLPTTIRFEEGRVHSRFFGDEDVSNGLEIGRSDGFSFTSSGDHFHMGSEFFRVPVNGTSILLQDREYSITMVNTAGNPFNLLSADMGEDNSYFDSATAIEVEGFFAGGGSIMTTITLDGDASRFQNETFAGFNNLSRVTFDGIGEAGHD